MTFIVCIFTGCNSAVTVGFGVLPDGSIRQVYQVVLDENELKLKYSGENIEKIYTTTYDYLNKLKESANLRAEQYMTEKGMSSHYPWRAGIEPAENNGVTSNGTIACVIQFYSEYFYKEYIKFIGGTVSDEGESEVTTKKGFFYDTIIYQDTELPVADIVEIQSVYDEIKNELLAKGVVFNEDLTKANIYYDYVVPLSYAQVNRLKSNAIREYIQVENQKVASGDTVAYNMKHYVFKYNPDGDNRLVLYRYRVNSVVWYLFALALLIVFAIVLLISYGIRTKIQTKKNINKEIKKNIYDKNISKQNDLTQQKSADELEVLKEQENRQLDKNTVQEYYDQIKNNKEIR